MDCDKFSQVSLNGELTICFFFYSQAMVRAGKQHLPRVVATICEVNFGPDIKYIELVFVVWPEFVCLEALFQAILLKAFRPFFSLQ